MKFTLEINFPNDEAVTYGRILREAKHAIEANVVLSGVADLKDKFVGTVARWEIAEDRSQLPQDEHKTLATLPTPSEDDEPETAPNKYGDGFPAPHKYSDPHGDGYCFDCGLAKDHSEANHID